MQNSSFKIYCNFCHSVTKVTILEKMFTEHINYFCICCGKEIKEEPMSFDEVAVFLEKIADLVDDVLLGPLAVSKKSLKNTAFYLRSEYGKKSCITPK